MNLIRLILLIILTTLSCTAIATPEQIIIIRHADKLKQENKGPTLSAKGYIRAIKFAYYYLKNYREPDFLFAKNPEDNHGKDISFRELQTLAPLANMLEQAHPENYISVLHPYNSDEYQKLADLILTNKKFNHKTILICWNHLNIPNLAHALGVTASIPDWSDKDFDSVFVLNYYNRDVPDFIILRNQYPMTDEPTWMTIQPYTHSSN